MSFDKLSYLDSCPDCDSLEIRIIKELFLEDIQESELNLKCYECGAEWVDYQAPPSG